MASSSTSSLHKSFKYDVFLSFRGEDTRTNFIDHLYHALQQKNIHTYKDDPRIKKGKNISDELIGAIEDSKFYIIVFSKNYASSSWCLDELVKIMECHRTTEHTAYPVFYDVEPSEVRKQSGAVAAAFSRYENEEAARKWRDALKEAADLAGWELKTTVDGHEAKFIQKIVEELSLELRAISFNIDETLVGMQCRIMKVISSLGIGFDDVRMIGIKGMGGGGKTTLARAIFDQISFRFEGKSFVENVREASNASLSGLKLLQSQVLSDVLNDKGINVSSVYDGKHMMKRTMRNKKVLLVLDDVDHIDQLEALAGEADWFKAGSRIIITTRDEQVLVAHRVKFIHDVVLLSDMEATCLFSRYAFGKGIPIRGYDGLSRQVLRYAAGLPLTIRVLGSFLCGKNDLEWVDALERLKTIPLAETLKKLEISYTYLEEDYKEIFLDIACIMKGWPKDLAIKALEICGFHARNGLRVLEQKSLITINRYSFEEYVDMHDHIQELGRNIVRRTHPDKPQKHSRLWIAEEIEEILANDMGTKATRCIQFYASKFNPHIIKGLGNMTELRFLSTIFGCYTHDLDFDNIAIPAFPDSLHYLRLDYYPFKYLSEVGENKVLKKLKYLNLSNSMLRTLDGGKTPNLETLNLRSCYKLKELHMAHDYQKLISVNITDTSLRTLHLGLAPNLKTLNFENCCDLEELHMAHDYQKLISVNITNSSLRTLHLGLAPHLETLILENCYNLEELHMAHEYQKLISIDITYSKMRTFHFGLAPNLETLNLEDCCDLEELHMADEYQKLISVNITYSKMRTFDLGLAPNLEKLNLQNCFNLKELHTAIEYKKLTELNISHSKLRTLNLGMTPNLKKLHLQGCSNLVELHTHIGCLKKLANLDVSGCLGFSSFLFQLQDNTSCSVDELVEVGPLAELHLISKSVESCYLHPDNSLPNFQLSCIFEEGPSSTRNLKMLISLGICSCIDLVAFSDFICAKKRLRVLRLEGNNTLQLLKDREQLECLEELTLSSTTIRHFPDSICRLKYLKSLELDRCLLLENIPEDLGGLECLEKLHLSYTKIKHLPDNICMLKHLKSLKLRFCCFLEKLPHDLGRLECLEDLTLSSTMIRHLPDSICMLKHLKSLELISCSLLEKLPEDLGSLTCLKELNTEGTSISHLPQSILLLKDLHIIGSRGFVQSCGFTPEIQTPECETSYVRIHGNGMNLRISERESQFKNNYCNRTLGGPHVSSCDSPTTSSAQGDLATSSSSGGESPTTGSSEGETS